MSKISLFIVIPVHNRIQYTRDCLSSLNNQTAKDFHIIVIDDGSTDGTSEMIFNEFPDVILLRGDGNLWWTAATNLGVKYALEHGSTHIMTLNNDTIAPKDFLQNMISWSIQKPGCLLGALALDAKTKQRVYGGERIRWDFGDAVQLLGVIKPGEQVGLHEVTHFPGRGLYIPSVVFAKIGLFDQYTFPHYAADYDFTHRATRAGFKIYCNYDAPLLIYPEASDSVKYRKSRNLKNYYFHLFGIKGAGNLGVFTKYVRRNCPPKYQVFFFVRGYTQRIIGYWI